jgi:penicillin amidase
MRSGLALLLACVTSSVVGGTGCGGDDGGDDAPGPFDSLPVTGDFTAEGLDGTIHVARDRYGIAHIRASSTRDLGYAQGYVMAHDRLPQMDILRRYGAGTLGVLFGALDQGVVETDLEMRMHRMKPLAEETWAMLTASSDPADVDIVNLLQRFADGVNAYAADLQAQRWQIDDAVATSFDPSRFEPWTPIDSLVLGRFQAFSLSWTLPVELDFTELFQSLHEEYDLAAPADAAQYARRGLAGELLHVEPIGKRPTIDGFPNVATDTGTRSDAGRPTKPGARRKNAAAAAAAASRPHVPPAVLSNARRFFDDTLTNGPLGAIGPHAFMAPNAGSNNWAVAPTLANGKALLATDQHLQLPNPSIFYPIHLSVTDANDAVITDVMGVTFPGIPGVILGTNGKVAWAATVSYHDVNDVYLEEIVPCPSTGDCVMHDGSPVPIETRTETFQLGALGTVTSSFDATYETVPHHGPIIPTIEAGQIVPRTADSALSVAFTGYVPTFEIRAIWNLAHAQTVDDGFKALADFSYGSQNWTMIDNAGNIAWTTNAKVPLREVDAYAWNATTAPDALAPFMILPGTGGGDWTGFMSTRYIPHAINPEQGYLATANSDPVGATFDRDALNQDIADGVPLYAGVTYAPGLRTERISSLIQELSVGGLDLTKMAQIQHDTRSTVGHHMRDSLVGVLGIIDAPASQPADAVTYYNALSGPDRTRLGAARTLLENWSLETPAMKTGDSGEFRDSAATALFNAFMHYFIEGVLADELDALPTPFPVWRIDQDLSVRVVWGVLAQPGNYRASATTDQPIVCDDISVAGADQSCSQQVMRALLAAMDWLASSGGFGSADPATWRWGDKHTLTLSPLFPNTSLQLPPPDETNPRWQGGYPKAGDQFVVNVANPGWNNLDFRQGGSGAAQRFLAEATVGQPISVKWALPGGTIYNRDSTHYRDLLDNYYIPQTHFDAPFAVADIVANGEDRWVFHNP